MYLFSELFKLLIDVYFTILFTIIIYQVFRWKELLSPCIFSFFFTHFVDVTSNIAVKTKVVYPYRILQNQINPEKTSGVVTWKFLFHTNAFVWCMNYRWRKNILKKSLSHYPGGNCPIFRTSDTWSGG